MNLNVFIFRWYTLTSSRRLRKAECECTKSKMYFNFSSAFGGKDNSTKAKQYCPLMPDFSSFALRHWSKSPNWFTFPLNIPDGILADASYTEIKKGHVTFCVHLYSSSFFLFVFFSEHYVMRSR